MPTRERDSCRQTIWNTTLTIRAGGPSTHFGINGNSQCGERMTIGIESWSAESCRVTAFSPEVYARSVEETFQAFTGQEPDSIASDRGTFQKTATGSWGSGNVHLVL